MNPITILGEFLGGSATAVYVANCLGVYYGVALVGVMVGLSVEFAIGAYRFFKILFP